MQRSENIGQCVCVCHFAGALLLGAQACVYVVLVKSVHEFVMCVRVCVCKVLFTAAGRKTHCCFIFDFMISHACLRHAFLFCVYFNFFCLLGCQTLICVHCPCVGFTFFSGVALGFHLCSCLSEMMMQGHYNSDFYYCFYAGFHVWSLLVFTVVPNLSPSIFCPSRIKGKTKMKEKQYLLHCCPF